MKESTSKEKILKKIRGALIYKDVDSFPDVDLDSPIHLSSDEAPEIRFAQNFTEVTGKFAFCEDKNELSALLWQVLQDKGYSEVFCLEEPVKKLMTAASIPFSDKTEELSKHKITVTLCESLVARTGSIMISSGQAAGRKLHGFPDVHVILANSEQIVPDIQDAFAALKSKYKGEIPSLVSLVSGPSRTADIEKTLVLGAHGPKEIYVFLLDQQF